jgi:hypothetical protein
VTPANAKFSPENSATAPRLREGFSFCRGHPAKTNPLTIFFYPWLAFN